MDLVAILSEDVLLYVVILCCVEFITLELIQFSGIIQSFCSLGASSASSDEVEIKTSAALTALTDFSVF